ncbi:unnamed protein product [Spirodela intermedia]|uniref:Uncharacterized protein n=1 Tax=Spirodela intermedia TaxID=51605 RepID=A0A7I8ITJ4_SPIIN|nr:unnamed protein product [Spirodela intermedia]CAA6661343.1 unnamed protein product [Spirodela intermedia]
MQAARGPALLAPSFPAQVSGKMVERSGAARKMAWSVTASCSFPTSAAAAAAAAAESPPGLSQLRPKAMGKEEMADPEQVAR